MKLTQQPDRDEFNLKKKKKRKSFNSPAFHKA